jgi:thiol-disulfide isomerase/thioredoxin
MKVLLLAFIFLIAGNCSYAQDPTPSAETVMNNAYQQATQENKKVFVMFHASWCGWCRKMDAAMNDASCKKAFESSYVIVHLTVEESKDKKDLENAGADFLKRKWLGEKAGLPFWLILDKDGNVLADSYIRKPGIPTDQPGDNVGCPASDEEITMFLKILRKTSTITDSKLETIGKRFKKNKQTL